MVRPVTLIRTVVLAVLLWGISVPVATVEAGSTHREPPDNRWIFPMADVLIDAGHGGIDGGTHYGDVMEKDINLAISRKLYLLLRSKGIAAVLNRTGDYALSDDNRWHESRSRHRRDLSQRSGLPKEIGASLFVSIHVNWAPRGGSRGPLVLHRSEGKSSLLASFVQDSLNRQQNIRRQPRAANQFYVLNTVQPPGILVESGFLSHPSDREMLTSSRGQALIAEAIASGIIAYRTIGP